ncbi:Uncharacterised protein [Sphingobacterium spiritivorum]|nr:Uncharacterised protein [Sphingobacterium spiritivorum]
MDFLSVTLYFSSILLFLTRRKTFQIACKNYQKSTFLNKSIANLILNLVFKKNSKKPNFNCVFLSIFCHQFLQVLPVEITPQN